MEQLFAKLDKAKIVSQQSEQIIRIIENNLIRNDNVFTKITTNIYIGNLETLQVKRYDKQVLDANITKLKELDIACIVPVVEQIYEKQMNLYGSAGIGIVNLPDVTYASLNKLFNILVTKCINPGKKVMIACKDSCKLSPYIAGMFYTYMIYKARKEQHYKLTLSLDKFCFSEAISYICSIKTDLYINYSLITMMLNMELGEKFSFIKSFVQPLIDNGTIDISGILNMQHLLRELTSHMNNSAMFTPEPEKKEIKASDLVILKQFIRPVVRPKIKELMELPVIEIPKVAENVEKQPRPVQSQQQPVQPVQPQLEQPVQPQQQPVQSQPEPAQPVPVQPAQSQQPQPVQPQQPEIQPTEKKSDALMASIIDDFDDL